MSGTLIVLPTYNEALSLAKLVPQLRAAVPDAAILVVDDDSPDGTGAVADGLHEADGNVHVLHRTGRGGLGAAYRAGYGWALDRGFETLVQMDADGSHRAVDLPGLLAAAESHDLVVGSRWVRGGAAVQWPLKRMLLSRAGSTYAHVLLGLPFKDITGGYRVFSARALRAIDATNVDSRGYCFQIEMLMRANDAGLSIVEVPITFVDREFGESKMSGGIVREALQAVTRWGWQRLWSPNPGSLPAAVER
ncbi:MAG: polyprenol monophosphomannose synthase [Rhodoglobus sp.]